MPRTARTVVPGLPHHVTQRGNFGQRIYRDATDFALYRELLRIYSSRYGTAIWAYCLMPNHVHVIAVPARENSLHLTFQATHGTYARHLNERCERRGHAFQARFFSCVLEDDHLHNAIRYVENNPVRARLAEVAAEYPWSSAAAHVHGSEDALLSRCRLLDTTGDWRDYLCLAEEQGWVESFKRSTNDGRPLGSRTFVTTLEKMTGISLRETPRGRPRKKQEDDKIKQ